MEGGRMADRAVFRIGVAVIGGGPAGIAAAVAASDSGASVLLVEREARLGGILKQCIHDGFGLIRYGEKLAGPEYACREIRVLKQTNVRILLQTYLTRIEKVGRSFLLTLVNRDGIVQFEANSLILATGCRERTAKQIAIHGMRPAGVFTAGNAQYYTNILGQLPTKRCVILGSGDIGLIMARRLKLEGAEVVGVYEIKPSPGGLLRNIVQCLHDFKIPLHLGYTVTRLIGAERLHAVEISKVDKNLNPIKGSQRYIKCDALILSVGLIPENELAESLGVEISRATGGPLCDQNCMTSVDGVFSCGNAMHISDLVDYVSESGETAGRGAAGYSNHQCTFADVGWDKGFQYVVPQRLDTATLRSGTVMFFRSSGVRDNATVRILANGNEIFSKEYRQLRPPEMQRIEVNFGDELQPGSKITFKIDASTPRGKQDTGYGAQGTGDSEEYGEAEYGEAEYGEVEYDETEYGEIEYDEVEYNEMEDGEAEDIVSL